MLFLTTNDFFIEFKNTILSNCIFIKRSIDNKVLDEMGLSQMIYQFARRWEAGLRSEFIGYPQETVRQWGLSPALTFLASEYFRIRAQYNYVDIRGNARTQHEAFLQIQFNMGPHGAHIF